MKKFGIFILFIFLLGMAPLLRAQTESIMLGPTDFFPMNNNMDHYQYGNYMQMSSGTSGTFFAPLHIPQGKRIKYLTLFYLDNTTSSISFELHRSNLYSGAINPIFYDQTSGSSSSRRILKMTPNWAFNLVNNTGYHYYLLLYFSSGTQGTNLQFYGAKVVYE